MPAWAFITMLVFLFSIGLELKSITLTSCSTRIRNDGKQRG